MEFTPEQWRGLKRHADERGLLFLSSPFSVEAAELLTRVGVAAWKVASGELTNAPLLERLASTGLPLLLSTGMSPVAEIDAVVTWANTRALPFALLQSTSAYPCPPEKVGLNLIEFFRERYGCPVGLSDHSGTIFPGLAAAALGVTVVEVHVTLSREMLGPDLDASVTTVELAQLVEGVRFLETARVNPVDKDQLADELGDMRATFMKSVVTRIELPAGTVLREEHLALKKPARGLAPARMPAVIGTRLRRRVPAGAFLSEADLEQAD
jgi:N-acetylneuraminate synthase